MILVAKEQTYRLMVSVYDHPSIPVTRVASQASCLPLKVGEGDIYRKII